MPRHLTAIPVEKLQLHQPFVTAKWIPQSDYAVRIFAPGEVGNVHPDSYSIWLSSGALLIIPPRRVVYRVSAYPEAS